MARYTRIPSIASPVAQSLASRVNVKTDLDITTSTEDSYIDRLIAAASLDAINYCGRQFLKDTIVETFYISECVDILATSRYPIVTITSITVDGVALTADEYLYEKETGFIRKLDEDGDLEDWDAEKTVVTYEGGYTTVPADLEAAVISLIKGRRAARRRDPSVRSEKVPDVLETTYWVKGPGEADLPPDVAGVFDRYREMRV